MAVKARVLQMLAPIQRALQIYGSFLRRFVYPVLDEFRWARWIVPGVMYGVVAILIGHIAGEKAGGVAVAIVVILCLAQAFDSIFHAESWILYTLLVWFMASIFLVLLDTPERAVEMLTDVRVYAIMGGFVGGFFLVVLLFAFVGLHDIGIDDWRNTRLRDRVSAETGMAATDVDRVLAALDVEMSDSDLAPDWQPLATVEAYNQDYERRRRHRRFAREQRRAERAARKAAK